jgi:hypothetical protein
MLLSREIERGVAASLHRLVAAAEQAWQLHPDPSRR